jgi:hypothetical protein
LRLCQAQQRDLCMDRENGSSLRATVGAESIDTTALQFFSY